MRRQLGSRRSTLIPGAAGLKPHEATFPEPVLGRQNPERLTCYCWCGRRQMEVSTAMVRAGKTASCGRPRCYEGRTEGET